MTAATGRRAVIVGGVRTPFAKAGGALEPLSAADLGALVLREALARTGVSAADVQHVVMGCVGVPSDSANVARVSAVRAGLPVEVPAYTVQRNCASGMEAVAQAALLVETGRADVVLCGGTESMSNYAVELPRSFRRKAGAIVRAKGPVRKALARTRFRPRDYVPELALVKGLNDPTCGLSMGQTAEVLARELSISRREQDEYAVESHRRAAAAAARRREESVAVVVPGRSEAVVADDGVRPDQTMEKLARLRPAFERRHGTVTPGNACGITDGACALVVAGEDWARARSLEHLATIRATSVAGVAPQRMGLGPCAALPRALEAAGWSLSELGLVEINEAFAVQVMACLRVMADATLMARHAGWPRALGQVKLDHLNVNGGAIALGHPVGVSGARLVLTLALEMGRRGVRRGAATLCIGGGQGQALLLER
jgi:acetyl-CoA acetyltransferase family protein